MTELAGTITATVLGETAPVITATDILKAKDKVFKGGENGQLKIVDVSKTDQITIKDKAFTARRERPNQDR